MRRFLLLIALLVLIVPLAACQGTCGQLPNMRLALPSADLPPPVSFYNAPNFQPTGYQQVMQVPAAPQYAGVSVAPQYAAPSCPSAQPQPGYSSGYQFAAPPVPGSTGCR